MKSNSAKTGTRKIKYIDLISFKILRAKAVGDKGAVAFDMVLNDVTIYGCWVHEGKNGDFISFPQRQGNDGKYYSIVWAPMDEEDTKRVLEEVERVLNSEE